ncbi:hypothetical protein TRICI_002014 [Trichomonascus ciferrii]|uniref:Uncharacterized protein n=1 Tax=Trichomonascus ciferrii TaxID=44093 RepID=A0A642V7S7_9ASCO|nr:hypothetical protein TRICI_002014 [Trichomonascus ciferrii]
MYSEYSLVQDIYQKYDNEYDRQDIIRLNTTPDRTSSELLIIGAGTYSSPTTMETGLEDEPFDLGISKPHLDSNKIHRL